MESKIAEINQYLEEYNKLKVKKAESEIKDFEIQLVNSLKKKIEQYQKKVNCEAQNYNKCLQEQEKNLIKQINDYENSYKKTIIEQISKKQKKISKNEKQKVQDYCKYMQDKLQNLTNNIEEKQKKALQKKRMNIQIDIDKEFILLNDEIENIDLQLEYLDLCQEEKSIFGQMKIKNSD